MSCSRPASPRGLWDEGVLYTPDAPRIDLSTFPEEERILRAQLHTCDLKATTQTLKSAPEDFEPGTSCLPPSPAKPLPTPS